MCIWMLEDHNSHQKGCFFHYTHSVFGAKHRLRDLSPTTKTNLRSIDSYTGQLVFPLYHRPLVPLAAIEVWYYELDVLENSDLTTNATTFLDFTTHRLRPTWNHYQTVRLRTTNNIEGWHNDDKSATSVHLQLTYIPERRASSQ